MSLNGLGRIFMVSLEGRGVDENAAFLRKIRPGAIALFANDFSSPEEMNSLISGLHRFYKTELSLPPPLISIDQEGGRVQRSLDIQGPPGAMAIGAAADPMLAEFAGSLLGSRLRQVGVDWDLAPVLDVNRNPMNPIIGTRSFGDDIGQVSLLGSRFIRGMRSQGCITTAKHFPGHGSVDFDSHVDIPVDGRDAPMIREDARPFVEALKAGVDSVMISHLSYPSLTGDKSLPATFSRDIITGYLKNELSCNAVVMTDSMSMGAVKKHYTGSESALLAIEAGIDLIATTDREQAGEMYDALQSAGSRLESRLVDAMKRVSTLSRSDVLAAPVPETPISDLVYSSIVRIGPDLHPENPLGRVWSVYDFDVKVAGRTFSPLQLALKKLGVRYEVGGETDHAIIQMCDEHISPHHDLQSILKRHRYAFAIGLATPYDAGLAGGVPYYTGFSPDIRSVTASLEALFGYFTPHGRLPVRLDAPSRGGVIDGQVSGQS